MPIDVHRELVLLKKMTFRQLREKYEEVFGDPCRSGHRDFLVRRIIWRLQTLEEGDLTERARWRAAELARDADLRLGAPSSLAPLKLHPGKSPRLTPSPSTSRSLTSAADNRLPMAGSVITRKYRGRTIQVRVLEKGFEHEGQTFRSLSAIAHAVTGSHWNGWLFFGLTPSRKDQAVP